MRDVSILRLEQEIADLDKQIAEKLQIVRREQRAIRNLRQTKEFKITLLDRLKSEGSIE